MHDVKPFKLELKEVEPIHKDKVGAFVSRTDGTGGVEIIDHSTYPEERVAAGKALRDFRTELKLPLGKAARRLGITVSEMSGLEHGRYIADFEEARKRLSNEISVGDTVVAIWHTKTGKEKAIRGLVIALTEKRVQIKYSHTSSSGRDFSWSVKEVWRQRSEVKKVTPTEFEQKSPNDALGEFVHALAGK